MTTLTHLECSLCHKKGDPVKIQGRCPCGGALLVVYDLENARLGWSREWLSNAAPTMWRYAPLLPAANPGAAVSLGEGMTPLLSARRLAQALGAASIWIKDEGLNPAGSIYSRAFSCAVSMALELGARGVASEEDGHAAAALAAYAAAAGIEAWIAFPPNASRPSFIIAAAHGAHAGAAPSGASELGAFQEPYRLEGLKTVGYEIAEQSRWNLPDVIICPAGDGAVLAGLWKAIEELSAIGWIPAKRPRLIAVEAEGCQPLGQALRRGADRCVPWDDPQALSADMRVAAPAGDHLALNALRRSQGAAVAVGDQEMLDAGVRLAKMEGVFACLAGAACVAAAARLLKDGLIQSGETVTIINPASGAADLRIYGARFPHRPPGEQDKLGGLITPR